MCSDGRRSNSGFSLLDAVGATGLLGVALLGLSAGPLTLVRNARTAEGVSVATALAQQELERVRDLPLGSSALTEGVLDGPGAGLADDGESDGDFHRTTTVSAPDVPRAGLRTVIVEVRWTDDRPHRLVLAAYVRCAATPCP